MSNMSYCRFENTSRDLADCAQALRECSELPNISNRYEYPALLNLIALCRQISEQFDGMDESDIAEWIEDHSYES